MTINCPLCGKFTNQKTILKFGWCNKCQKPFNNADKINQRVEKFLRA